MGIQTDGDSNRWGFKQKGPGKVHVKTASYEEKKQFKKEHAR
ncbi:MAG: hypothetical protein ACRD8W_17985 [Nitrososphaeraceae archaeon]